MKKITKALLLGLLFVGTWGCQKEFFNPSSASQDEIIKTADGLIAMCNGNQFRWSVGRQSPIYTVPVADQLSGRGLIVLNAGNTDENFLMGGGAGVAGNNALITNIWTQCQLTRNSADIILANVSVAGVKGDNAAITAHASIFRALALGTMAQFFEKTTIASQEAAPFVGRDEALREAVKSLKIAVGAMENIVAADLVNFNSKIAAGIDLKNTANALLARYLMMLGGNNDAVFHAGLVDLTKKSEFKFSDINRNAIWDQAFSNTNVVQPVDSALGLPAGLAPTSGDKRVLFYLKSKTPSTTGVYSGTGFWTSNSAAVPVYLPGEMTLIIAEDYARNGKLPEAVIELNKVLTKTTDAFGIGAGLAAYSGAMDKDAILQEIYRNRCIELFMSGMRLEDCRRFGRPAPSLNGTTLENATERNRIWYPYPNSERDNNVNTPPNPTI